MNQSKIYGVTGQTDVVLLRMSVRDMARSHGLSLSDQARISLATSTMVEAIEVSAAFPGQATVDEYARGNKVGMRVIYQAQNDHRGHWSKILGNVKWMVDETLVEELPDDQIQVTLIKWKA